MLFRTITLFATCIALNANSQNLQSLEIGTKMPAMDQAVTNLNGDQTTLSDLKGQQGTLVIFSCNTCPFVVGSDGSEGWENRYNGISQMAKEHSVNTVLINSNEAKREMGDGLEDMKARAKEKEYTANYVLDKNSVVADAFGARTTPHVYLFDKDAELNLCRRHRR